MGLGADGVNSPDETKVRGMSVGVGWSPGAGALSQQAVMTVGTTRAGMV